MAYKMGWLVEGRIALIYLSDIITTDEAFHFDPDILPYLEHGRESHVHLLFDMSGLEKLPGITTLNKFRWPKHPRVGWVIGYPEPGPMISFVALMTAQIFRSRYRTTNTLEEALTFLQQEDATLPDLSKAKSG
jgi:hypothetical protein